MIKVNGKYTTAHIMIDNIEEEAMSQIVLFVNHEAFTNHVVIMPDTHAGKGSVIGFTMPLTNKVIPNVIGVDIGCGVSAYNVGDINKLKIPFHELDQRIRAKIPFGSKVHEGSQINMEKEFPWKTANKLAVKFCQKYQQEFGYIQPPVFTMDWFMEKCKQIGIDVRRAINSIGTLGGGNHFIEFGVTESKNECWFKVHSGSRNFGKRVCEFWQGKAEKLHKKSLETDVNEMIEDAKIRISDKKELYEKIKELKAQRKHGININGREWLCDELAQGYLFDMIFSQVYAEENRKCMSRIIGKITGLQPDVSIESVHNFIDFNDFIIRKGAIRSYTDELMVIPLNMRDGTLICEGKSNSEWNFSAPHGAGRLMSRSKARKELSVSEFTEQMKGVFSTSVGFDTIDESPMAYKPAQFIKDAIEPSVKIIDCIKPVMNLKDSNGDENL